MANISKETLAGHWQKTRGLLVTTLAIWAFFALILQFFVGALNQFSILGFPFGYYMAAQGSQLIFVVLIFWFASRQNRIDSEFGVAEDE